MDPVVITSRLSVTPLIGGNVSGRALIELDELRYSTVFTRGKFHACFYVPEIFGNIEVEVVRATLFSVVIELVEEAAGRASVGVDVASA